MSHTRLRNQSHARFRRLAGLGLAALLIGPFAAMPAAAKSCEQLRALCYTMRDDKSDCTKPYQRCLKTGEFVTPLGRHFKATSK